MTQTLFTCAQVAAQLGVSGKTVNRVAAIERIGTRYANQRLYSASDVASIAARNTRKGWLPGEHQPHQAARKKAAKQAAAKKSRRRKSIGRKGVATTAKKS